MSEREPSRPGELSQADRTLLGVAPPRIESTTESPLRSPVFVRSGTSVADVEPPPVPRMALPSRPPPRMLETPGVSEPPSAFTDRGRGMAWVVAMLNLPARVAGYELALWMVLMPVLLSAAAFVLLLITLAGSQAKPSATAAAPAAVPAPQVEPLRVTNTGAKPAGGGLAALEARPLDSLSSSELVSLAEGRAERQRDAAKALRLKVEGDPAVALGKDKALQVELLRLAANTETAREGLAAIAKLEAPVGPDLLYEVWTGTSARNDTTELARALVYSTDIRPKASPALAVALELRVAETCEQYRAALPKALKDGDRRALHLLTKLTSKRGCGPKKTDDCFACLRDRPDEVPATINAVKTRRPPSYPAP